MIFSSAEFLQLVMAFLGSLGFALLFHTPAKCLPTAASGGLVSWAVYLLTTHGGYDYMMACLLAGIAAALWSELFARIQKKPVTVFLISAVVPLIPGRAMYLTMSALVTGALDTAWSQGVVMVLSMLFIAAGTSLVAAVFVLFTKGKHERV
ncbi:MAG: threonine/serine exporter family protein [Lachnospiraceae bacterium]|nr:threonine/serine exporter family protein [Lachnospiraceae bacterium]